MLAEEAAAALGARVQYVEEVLALLLPRVIGDVSGGDTYSHSKSYLSYINVVIFV